MAHQRVLERLFNSDEFHDMDEYTRSVLTAHWQAHDNQKMQKLAQQMQMMAMQNGTPSQPGVASQPSR
jgi:Arc/MetJ-type ribon-helix-helix transcriptional regulator